MNGDVMVYEFRTKENGRFLICDEDIIGLVESTREKEVGILTKTNCWFVIHSYDELQKLLFSEVRRLEQL